MTANNPSWCLLRLDDNGNRFVMRSGLSREQAEALARDYQARGHKQTYWAEPEKEKGAPV